MDLAWYDFVGTAGVLIIVATYFLLQVGRISSLDPAYSWLNLVGAVMILLSLYYNFNFASVVIEAFWIIISLIGLWRSFRARREKPED